MAIRVTSERIGGGFTVNPFNGLNECVMRAYHAAGAPRFTVSDYAPQTVAELLASWGETRTLVIWSGGTETAIYRDPRINWVFRAWHDWSHVRTRIGFTVDDEVILANWQCGEAGRIGSLFADVVWLEIAGQALEYRRTGGFLPNQTEWTLAQLRQRGVRV